MKKKSVAIVLAFLALVLAVAPLQTASASSQREATGGISVVAVSGDSEFTTTVLKPEKLAGIQTVADAVYPAGFVAKEVQFIGNAVNVLGHSYGEAKACFAFPTSAQGWVGTIYQWDGARWNKLTTALIAPTDGTPSACASFYGNGDLALIGAYTGPNEKTGIANLPDCIDKEKEAVREGYIGAYPILSLVDWGEGWGILGIGAFTYTGTGGAPVPVPSVPVKVYITSATPANVVKVVKAKGSGVTDDWGYATALTQFKLVSSGDYIVHFTIVVDGRCKVTDVYGSGE